MSAPGNKTPHEPAALLSDDEFNAAASDIVARHPVSAAHTPGEWTVREIVNDLDMAFSVEAGRLAIADCYRSETSHTEAIANARLIAAAPELLEASRALVAAEDELFVHLQELGEDIEQYGFPFPLMDALRAAIAKATGAA